MLRQPEDQESSKGLCVCVHGFSTEAAIYLPLMDQLLDAGYSVSVSACVLPLCCFQPTPFHLDSRPSSAIFFVCVFVLFVLYVYVFCFVCVVLCVCVVCLCCMFVLCVCVVCCVCLFVPMLVVFVCLCVFLSSPPSFSPFPLRLALWRRHLPWTCMGAGTLMLRQRTFRMTCRCSRHACASCCLLLLTRPRTCPCRA